MIGSYRWQFRVIRLRLCLSPASRVSKGPRLVSHSISPIPMPETNQHPLEPLRRLMQTLQQRTVDRPEGSYTTKLLDGGLEKIGAKIREEADELIESASEPGDPGREHFVYEAGDLIYHALVLLAWRGVDLEEIAAELARREGTSGLVEKANRSKPTNDNQSASE